MFPSKNLPSYKLFLKNSKVLKNEKSTSIQGVRKEPIDVPKPLEGSDGAVGSTKFKTCKLNLLCWALLLPTLAKKVFQGKSFHNNCWILA